jgi:hypothetical protein
MFRLFFYLALLGAVGYAAVRVPIGGKTAWQHLQQNVKWDDVARKGSSMGRAARDAVSRAVEGDAPKDADAAPSRGPEKPAPQASDRAGSKAPARVTSAPPSHEPAEKVTQGEREALDRLMR